MKNLKEATLALTIFGVNQISSAAVTGLEFTLPDQHMGSAPQYKINTSYFDWHFRMNTFDANPYYPTNCEKYNIERLRLEFEVHGWSNASAANGNEIHGAVMLRNNTIEVTPNNPTIPGRAANGYTPGPANGWSRDGTWIEPAWARVSTGVGVAFGSLMPNMRNHIAIEMFNKQVPGRSPLILGSEGPWWTHIYWVPATYRIHVSSFLSRDGSNIPRHSSSSVVAYAVDYRLNDGDWTPWIPIKFAYDDQIRNIEVGSEHSDAPHVYGREISFSTTLKPGSTQLYNPPVFKNIKAQWSCY
ncbi:MAG: hypothetical protein Q4F13_12655 [Pseudomonadota bacterium]|nr:hypothetical protein [Pseudomonadota bacterium]